MGGERESDELICTTGETGGEWWGWGSRNKAGRWLQRWTNTIHYGASPGYCFRLHCAGKCTRPRVHSLLNHWAKHVEKGGLGYHL